MSTANPLAPALKLLLALGVGLSAGLLAQRYALPWFEAHFQAADAPTPRPTLAEHQLVGASPSAPARRPARQANPGPAVRLEAGIVFADDPQAVNEGKVALPGGTRFQISVSSDQPGRVQAWATNPEGVRSGPLWTTQITPGAPALSPALRLDGRTGLERLDIELHNAAGARVAQRTLEIWHQ